MDRSEVAAVKTKRWPNSTRCAVIITGISMAVVYQMYDAILVRHALSAENITRYSVRHKPLRIDKVNRITIW